MAKKVAKPAKKGAAARTRRSEATPKTPKRASARRATRGDSPVRRAKRVAKEVAHQAQAAVSGGVEALRELRDNIIERVGG
jgi:hypothetical protein